LRRLVAAQLAQLREREFAGRSVKPGFWLFLQ
jgi:hypothetical protein